MVLILVMLALVALLAMPTWSHSVHWGGGWAPTSLFGLALAVLLVLFLLGRL